MIADPEIFENTQRQTKRLHLVHAAQERQQEIARELQTAYGGRVVQSGPFRGMKIPEESCWGGGDMSSKILGCYEEELHPAIEQMIGRNPDRIINVGCAEGYYGVGFSMRCPEASLLMVDIEQRAIGISLKALRENGAYGGRDVAFSGFSEATLFGSFSLASQCAIASRPLVVMDCEGAEAKLLSNSYLEAYKHVDFIIECHDYLDSNITPMLMNMFAKSHATDMVWEGARNPARYGVLKNFGTLDRCIACCEFRPVVMHWFVAQAKERR